MKEPASRKLLDTNANVCKDSLVITVTQVG